MPVAATATAQISMLAMLAATVRTAPTRMSFEPCEPSLALNRGFGSYLSGACDAFQAPRGGLQRSITSMHNTVGTQRQTTATPMHARIQANNAVAMARKQCRTPITLEACVAATGSNRH
jgi:hypothetical protein